MAAARRRGRWVGGKPVLGYDLLKGRLVVNPAEAQRVRALFELYLEQAALAPTLRVLAQRGWRTKQWTTRQGQARGGHGFCKSSLHYVLRNVTYLGKVCWNGQLYPGEQEAIVSEEVFQRVQALLVAKRRCEPGRRAVPRSALLAGRLFCAACQSAMVHTSTPKGRRRYRYYRCAGTSHPTTACPTPAIPAADLERVVHEAWRNFLACAPPSRPSSEETQLDDASQDQRLRALVSRVDYDSRDGTLALTLVAEASARGL